MHATNVIEDTLLVGKCYPNPDGIRWVFIGYIKGTKMPVWQIEKDYLLGCKSLLPIHILSSLEQGISDKSFISTTPVI